MDERKIIRTYTKAWKIDKVIYTIGDFKLPFPLAIDMMGYGLVGLLLAVLTSHIPVISSAPVLVRYGGFIIGLPYVLKKLKIHSKSPVRFLIDCFEFLSGPKALTRFQPVKTPPPIRFTNVRHKACEELDDVYLRG